MSRPEAIINSEGEILKAGCVIFNDAGEVLLVNDDIRKMWTFPKGHMEIGETVGQTAVREVKEETGYEVELLKRLSDTCYRNSQTDETIRVAFFKARIMGDRMTAEAGTYSRWMSLEQARILIPDNLLKTLDEALLD